MSARLATAMDQLANQWYAESNGSTLLVLKSYIPPPTNLSVSQISAYLIGSHRRCGLITLLDNDPVYLLLS
jgi:hypothetical protein